MVTRVTYPIKKSQGMHKQEIDVQLSSLPSRSDAVIS